MRHALLWAAWGAHLAARDAVSSGRTPAAHRAAAAGCCCCWRLVKKKAATFGLCFSRGFGLGRRVRSEPTRCQRGPRARGGGGRRREGGRRGRSCHPKVEAGVRVCCGLTGGTEHRAGSPNDRTRLRRTPCAGLPVVPWAPGPSAHPKLTAIKVKKINKYASPSCAGCARWSVCGRTTGDPRGAASVASGGAPYALRPAGRLRGARAGQDDEETLPCVCVCVCVCTQ